MSGLFKVPSKWSSDIVGWLYIGVQIMCGVLDFIVGQTTILLFVTMAILGSCEWRAMRKQGHAWPSSLWVLLFPVYLWKRLNALKLPKHMFWIWLVVVLVITAGIPAINNFMMVSADDLEGTWEFDAASTTQLLSESAEEHPTPDQLQAINASLESQFGGMTFSFSDNMMSVCTPPVPPISTSYQVLETGKNYLKIENEKGGAITVVFIDKRTIDLIEAGKTQGVILRKEGANSSIQSEATVANSSIAQTAESSDVDAAAIKKKYSGKVDALSGYSNIPWGASLNVVKVLAECPLRKFNYTENNLQSHYAWDWRERIEKLAGIALAPPPATSIYTGSVNVDASGSGGEKFFYFYFLDDKLYAVEVSFSFNNAWSVEKLKQTGKYVDRPEWKDSNWQMLHDTLEKKAGTPKDHSISSDGKTYKIIEWDDGVGCARMVFDVVGLSPGYSKGAVETDKYRLEFITYFSKGMKSQVESRHKAMIEEKAASKQREEQRRVQDALKNIVD